MLGPRLRAAVERLYQTFAGYPLVAVIEGCPCCSLETAERELHAAPLRELPEQHVGYFAFKAMTTFGRVDDFRHFLPRIAELISERGAADACDLGIFTGKLSYGGFETWPDAERAAVAGWVDALWDDYLDDDTARGTFATVMLDAASFGSAPLEAWLTRWPSARSERAFDDLAQMVAATASASNSDGLAYRTKPWGAALERFLREDSTVADAVRARAATSGSRDVALAVALLDFPPFVPSSRGR